MYSPNIGKICKVRQNFQDESLEVKQGNEIHLRAFRPCIVDTINSRFVSTIPMAKYDLQIV